MKNIIYIILLIIVAGLSYDYGKNFYKEAFESATQVIDECEAFIDEWNDGAFGDTIAEGENYANYLEYKTLCRHLSSLE